MDGAAKRSVEVADQHDVAGHIALGQKQLLAVARPRELKNSPRRKIGYLPRRATHERLFPDIRCTFPCQRKLQAFLIGGPAEGCGPARPSKNVHRVSSLSRNYSQL